MVELVRRAAVVVAVAGALACAERSDAGNVETVPVRATGFTLGAEKSAADGANRLELAIDPASSAMPPFTQCAVKQDTAPALLGPNPKIPYFTVRFAMPGFHRRI